MFDGMMDFFARQFESFPPTFPLQYTETYPPTFLSSLNVCPTPPYIPITNPAPTLRSPQKVPLQLLHLCT